jgi:PhnB protein
MDRSVLTRVFLVVERRGAGRGEVVQPLDDAFWGDRTGQFIDPFGHRWAIDQHLRDVPQDEVARLAAEAFGQGQG